MTARVVTVPDRLWLAHSRALSEADLTVSAVECSPGQTQRYVVCRSTPDLDAVASSDAVSDRERQVLAGAAAGMSNAAIGRELELSEDTVKTHLRRLYRKIGANDRAQAVAIGYETGLLGGKS